MEGGEESQLYYTTPQAKKQAGNAGIAKRSNVVTVSFRLNFPLGLRPPTGVLEHAVRRLQDVSIHGGVETPNLRPHPRRMVAV
jgi:hypothetical protein